MSRTSRAELACWDSEYVFQLRLGELRLLQEKCDAGPQHLYQRLGDGTWRVDDVRETLRLGLIGAGMEQQKALDAITRHVDTVPWLENVPTARAVLAAVLVGVEDEKLGK
ncbi:gene transfer agent family protein [Jiella marina]|uniref:gene transfer agent family protein n=1 Tax=Jiella sp. LLJ827 TaxID=2917712 RepID=UPI002101AD61|nr:gene transfer agent family protein [Jiella sp. LLJ827]MCQ0987547.1 gene transfer agent family protein [Jiella sp. LLJ827]